MKTQKYIRNFFIDLEWTQLLGETFQQVWLITFTHTRHTTRKSDAGLFIFQFKVGGFLLLLQWWFLPPYASEITEKKPCFLMESIQSSAIQVPSKDFDCWQRLSVSQSFFCLTLCRLTTNVKQYLRWKSLINLSTGTRPSLKGTKPNYSISSGSYSTEYLKMKLWKTEIL